jgi:hypothetical protein
MPIPKEISEIATIEDIQSLRHRCEALDVVLDYIHQMLIQVDRAASFEEKQAYLDLARNAALDGYDAYERIQGGNAGG